MEIRVGENESLESALKRFKRKTASWPKYVVVNTMKSPA